MITELIKCSVCDDMAIFTHTKPDVKPDPCSRCGSVMIQNHKTESIKLYTQSELDQAVKDEREVCAGMADIYTCPNLAEAIRNRQ